MGWARLRVGWGVLEGRLDRLEGVDKLGGADKLEGVDKLGGVNRQEERADKLEKLDEARGINRTGGRGGPGRMGRAKNAKMGICWRGACVCVCVYEASQAIH